MTATTPRLQPTAQRDAHWQQAGERKTKPATLWPWLMVEV